MSHDLVRYLAKVVLAEVMNRDGGCYGHWIGQQDVGAEKSVLEIQLNVGVGLRLTLYYLIFLPLHVFAHVEPQLRQLQRSRCQSLFLQ